MHLWLRQIAFVAAELAPVEEELLDVLGLKLCYNDPGVERFGLHNALYPIGTQFLEVVAPLDLAGDTAGKRYLDRRGGDGGYMVITQCDDHPPRRARVEELGIRLVSSRAEGEFLHMQLHPKDTGGSFFEIDQMNVDGGQSPDGPWHPAGHDWKPAMTDRVTAITAATMQCDDPPSTAARWAEIAQIPLQGNVLPLDNAELRFVPCADGRPEGLSELDLRGNADAVMEAGEARGVVTGDRQVTLCGVRINLV